MWQTWFLCHDQVSLRTFLHKSQVTRLLSLGSTGRGTSSCGITGLGVGIKVRALDFLKGVEQAVLAQQLTAHWQAGKQNHYNFFLLFCAFGEIL